MASKSTLTVKILGDAKGLTGAIDTASSKLGKFGKGAGKVLGGLGTLGVAAGGGLLAIGTSLDGALDKIIVGTGATGDQLGDLKEQFEDVAQRVPTSFGDASTAVADINTRLGLTGDALEDSSAQFLNLSRITGTDVGTNIANLSRVFGDAGIAVEDQSLAMDKLFRTSQATGIGLDQLSNSAVSFGAPMRQLGFSFEESISLLGKFEKEGVNTEAVMSGMKIGLGKLAAAGEEPAETFDRIVDSIANAGTQGEANALALEAFGQRAGPDMAAAIREGRFEIDEMVANLDGAGGAIEDTAAQTESWQEKLQVLKNKAMMKLAPVAEKVFAKVTEAVEAASPYLEQFAEWLGEKIPPIVADLRAWFEANWPAIRTTIQEVADWLVNSAWPVIQQVIGGIRTVAAAVVTWFQENWPAIQATISAVTTWLQETAWPIIQEVIGGIQVVAAAVHAWFVENWPGIQAAIGAVVTWLQETAWPIVQEVFQFMLDKQQEMADWVEENWPKIQETISTIISAIQTVIEVALGIIQTLWDVFGEHILSAAETVWETIKSVIDAAIKIVQGVIETVMNVITGDWSAAWESIKKTLSGVVDLFAGIVEGALDLVKTAIDGAWEGITTAAAAIWDAISEKVTDVFDDVVELVKGLPGRILEFAADMLSAGTGLGADFVTGLVDALKAAADFAGDIADGIIGAFKSAWNSAAGTINEFIPNSVSIPFAPDIDLPDNPIPTFHSGGFIGGRGSAPRDVPIVAQAGEYMMSRAEVAAGGPSWGSGGGSLVHADQIVMNNGTDIDTFAAAVALKVN